MKYKIKNSKFNILFLLIISSLFFLCGSMFMPQKNTYSETKWTDIVTLQDINDFSSLGNGTLEDPYLIKNAKQLATLSKLVSINSRSLELNDYYTNANYKLADNIVLNSTDYSYEWDPIGTITYPFKGVFDGNGYVISGININLSSSIVYAGLFGYVNGATIKNFSIMNFNSGIYANSAVSQTYAGGIAGYAQNSTFEDLSNLGVPVYSFSKDTAYAGGIVGFSSSCNFNIVSNYAIVISYIKNDISQKEIFGYAGGITGRAYGSINTITYARNNGTIKAYADGTKETTSNILGIIVKIHTPSAITKIFAGGIIGQSNIIISNSFNSGEIISGGDVNYVIGGITYTNYLPRYSYAGGIAGESTNIISNTFNTANISARASVIKIESTQTLKRYIRTRSYIDEHIGEGWNNQIYFNYWYNYYLPAINLPSQVENKLGNVITETSNAYSGGIVGFTYYKISNSYNDGKIVGGGIEKTECLSYLLSFQIERTGLFNAKGKIEKQIYYDIELKYFDELFYGSVNGNINASTDSSYGSSTTQNFEKTININSYYMTEYYDPLTNNYDISEPENNTATSSNKIYMTPYYNHIYHDTFSSGTEIQYIKNVQFTYGISRVDQNAVSQLSINFTLAYRSDVNGAGYLTGDYYTSPIICSSSVNLNQNINYLIKSATSVTTTNLGGSEFWAKTSGVNGNRPYIKDFFW